MTTTTQQKLNTQLSHMDEQWVPDIDAESSSDENNTEADEEEAEEEEEEEQEKEHLDTPAKTSVCKRTQFPILLVTYHS